MMLRPEYQGLFSDLERKEATQRLASATRSRSRGRLQAQPTEPK